VLQLVHKVCKMIAYGMRTCVTADVPTKTADVLSLHNYMCGCCDHGQSPGCSAGLPCLTLKYRSGCNSCRQSLGWKCASLSQHWLRAMYIATSNNCSCHWCALYDGAQLFCKCIVWVLDCLSSSSCC
jgi:hypothetical protein